MIACLLTLVAIGHAVEVTREIVWSTKTSEKSGWRFHGLFDARDAIVIKRTWLSGVQGHSVELCDVLDSDDCALDAYPFYTALPSPLYSRVYLAAMYINCVLEYPDQPHRCDYLLGMPDQALYTQWRLDSRLLNSVRLDSYERWASEHAPTSARTLRWEERSRRIQNKSNNVEDMWLPYQLCMDFSFGEKVACRSLFYDAVLPPYEIPRAYLVHATTLLDCLVNDKGDMATCSSTGNHFNETWS